MRERRGTTHQRLAESHGAWHRSHAMAGPVKDHSPEATWLSNKEWWFKRSVNVPERFAGRRIRLQFEATDYYADAWLNGTRFGAA